MEESPVTFDGNDKDDENKTPPKLTLEVEPDSIKPLNELNKFDPVDSEEKSPKLIENKTPEKTASFEPDQKTDLVDSDDGMLSTVEQARLLIAASKTPSKAVNRTPVKQNNHHRKRSIESSPITPGKQRRVELITLSSPKTKKLKQE